jgi:hypothetical protein
MLTFGDITDVDLRALHGHHLAYFFPFVVGSEVFFHPEDFGIEFY